MENNILKHFRLMVLLCVLTSLTVNLAVQMLTYGSPTFASVPAPVISTISPDSARQYDPVINVTVIGSNFTRDSIVFSVQDGVRRSLQTTYVSPTRLTATMSLDFMQLLGEFEIKVQNFSSSGGAGPISVNNATFTILERTDNPRPTLSGVVALDEDNIEIEPSQLWASDVSFEELKIRIGGYAFVPASLVYANGVQSNSEYVTSSLLNATIPASEVRLGDIRITVVNPSPGGGASNEVMLRIISNSVPQILALDPSSRRVNSGSFTMEIHGNNFVYYSVAYFDGIPIRGTIYSNDHHLSVVVPFSVISSSRNYSVTVRNPAPGGGTSNALTFTGYGPTITSVTPSSAIVGSQTINLTINGAGFIPSSMVYINGIAKRPTSVSTTQIMLQGAIPALSMTTTGTFRIEVFNDLPENVTSNAITFTVTRQ